MQRNKMCAAMNSKHKYFPLAFYIIAMNLKAQCVKWLFMNMWYSENTLLLRAATQYKPCLMQEAMVQILVYTVTACQ